MSTQKSINIHEQVATRKLGQSWAQNKHQAAIRCSYGIIGGDYTGCCQFLPFFIDLIITSSHHGEGVWICVEIDFSSPVLSRSRASGDSLNLLSCDFHLEIVLAKLNWGIT